MFRFQSPTKASRSGVALIITLAFLMVVTIILVAFVTTARLDRTATASYGQSILADQLAQGGLKLVVASLQQEMGKSGAPITNNGVAIYTNITSANLLPERVGTTGTLTNLVKISTNAPFYTGAMESLSASAINSTTANSVTRAVRLDRWNRPCFVTFTNAAEAPSWVYVTRNGPTNGTGIAFGLSGNTANNANPTNANFVLGRFAYAIYDEGNLLDITVAGHPSAGKSDLGAADISRKGSEALAELTEIPGLTNQADVDALIAWRNKASIASSYTNYLYNVAPTNGYLQVAPGDNTFLSRQDLIAYAETNGITNALPYLTTFSRELNSPSIPVGVNSTLNPDFRQLIYNGKPIQRFALSRFNLLVGDPSTLSPTDLGNILTYFGLTPSTGASSTWRSWQYRSTTIGTPQAAINSGREPDLFELVKAAITNGSLGAYLQDNGVIRSSTSNVTTTTTPYPPEQNIDQQVARIISNIIDQYGSDNYPTTIQMGSNPVSNTVYGIKSLPYFSEMLIKAYYPSLTFNNVTGANFYIYFQLWNPHRNTIPSVGPSDVQIVEDTQGKYLFNYVEYNSTTATTYSVYSSSVFHVLPSYGIDVGALGNYLEPHIVVNPNDTTSYQTGMATGSGANGFNAFLLDPPTRNMPTTFNNPSGGFINVLDFQSQTITFSLQYRDGGGNWRTYSTFSGYANDGGASGIQSSTVYLGDPTSLAANAPGSTTLRTFNNRIDLPNLGMPKPDPRTFRFRAGWYASIAQIAFNSAMVSGSDPGELWEQYYPGNFPAPRYAGMLYKNYGSGNPIVSDPDGTSRVADGYLSTEANPANPMWTSSTARPVILNRPFRSVGELGCVFRDAPWKSVNFFSVDSGDAALLDLFCLEDAPITAAKVNLNTPYQEVLRALLKGAIRDEMGSASPLSEADATQIASDILAKTQATPFLNRAALVNQLSTTTVSATYPAIKSQREASIRALGSVMQGRTWNFLIDLIAQSGRFSPAATGLEQFSVEGERRYWLHVAIDRITGQIIETQLEPVSE